MLFDLPGKEFRILKIGKPDAPAGGPVFIADRCPDRWCRSCWRLLLNLPGLVELFVIGHDHMGPVADLEHLRSAETCHLVLQQIVHLFEQHQGIHDHPVADEALFFLEDTGRHQVADELVLPSTTMVWPALFPP